MNFRHTGIGTLCSYWCGRLFPPASASECQRVPSNCANGRYSDAR